MIRTLGGIKFALFLIFCTAVLVISATFIESKYESHGLAEKWIYHSLFFKLLLAGFFINILFSTLTRWPFQRKHIPFLITHLGLLMIILGVFIKQQFGIQGVIKLTEGEATRDLIVNSELALVLENRKGEIKQYGLNDPLPHPLKIRRVEDNAKETFPAWIIDDSLHLMGYSPLPLPAFETYTINGKSLQVFAQNEPPSLAVLWGEKPFIYFYRDLDKLTLYHGNGFGHVHEQQLSAEMPKSYAMYDKGFQGYSAFLSLDFPSSPDPFLQQLLEQHSNELSPPLELVKEVCTKASLPLGETALEVLKTCSQGKPHWIDPLLDWQNVLESELNVLRWARELLKEMPDGESLHAHLKNIHWPYADKVLGINDFFSQLFSIKEDLPRLIGNQQLLPYYFQLYELDYRTLAKEVPEEIAFSVEIESPLWSQLQILKEDKQLEKNKPVLIVAEGNKEMALPFESPLKTILLNRTMLGSFENQKLPLPFEVRLHKARDIKYPGTEQTESYECCLTLRNEKVTLSMNRVHETADGYRLYLSGMTAIDPYNVRAVQLVVNRDPAKYLFTYPGALLVGLGIIGLFFYNKRPR